MWVLSSGGFHDPVDDARTRHSVGNDGACLNTLKRCLCLQTKGHRPNPIESCDYLYSTVDRPGSGPAT